MGYGNAIIHPSSRILQWWPTEDKVNVWKKLSFLNSWRLHERRCISAVSGEHGYPWFTVELILKIYGDLFLCAAYTKALEDAVAALKDIAFDIDVTDRKCLLSSPSLFRNWFGIAERS